MLVRLAGARSIVRRRYVCNVAATQYFRHVHDAAATGRRSLCNCDGRRQKLVGGRQTAVQVQGGGMSAAGEVVVVVVVAADQRLIRSTQGELFAAHQTALTRHALETRGVVDAPASSHHQMRLVETQPTAVTLHAEQPAPADQRALLTKTKLLTKAYRNAENMTASCRKAIHCFMLQLILLTLTFLHKFRLVFVYM